MKKSGRILIVAELAREYGFKDVGGTLVYLVSNSGKFDQAMILFLSYFFVKKYLLVAASSMFWTGQWISQ